MAAYLPLQQISQIRDQMIRSTCKYWWVLDTDKTVIAENESEAGTIDDCFNDLANVVNNLQGDFVVVIVRNKIPNKDKDGNYAPGVNTKKSLNAQVFEYRVKLTPVPGSERGATGGGINGLGSSNDLVFNLFREIGDLKAETAATKLQAQIDKLELQLKEGKNGKADYVSELIEQIAIKSVGLLKTGNVFTSPIAGETKKDPAPEKELTEEEKKTAGESFGKNLKDVTDVMGADIYRLAEALSKQAKANPEAFKQQAAAIIEASGT